MEEGLIKRIGERKEKLEEAKKALKKKFIGIDDVIDKIIDNIALWYLMPEIQFRPLIVSLWGITGVGKTDLVRTLIKALDFTDKFIEIQMDIKHDYTRNIEHYLENSGVDTSEPAVLLLDEIQRYRTIDEAGHMLDNKHFNDIWMLLSDGKFQNNSQRKREIMELLLEEMYWDDQRENADEVDEPSDGKSVGEDTPAKPKKPKNFKFKTSFWTANRFKKMLNLQMGVEEIMKMSLDERMNLMETSLKAGHVNEGKSYEKLLIFISGNLDEAFRMAEDVEDSESDADIMHELSKRVNIVQIKHALSRKFKPEQIARFGNNHIIYPCLDKKAYQTIIYMNCQEILDRIQKEHDVHVELSQDIYDIIYRNGVFPTQGVRPAISTVFNLLGSNLPHFLYHALISDVKQFKLEYGKKKLFAEIKNKKISKPIILEIDDIRNNKSIDEKMLVLVHEIGHALVYALLFNTPPKQINTNSSGLSNGFVINHNSVDNKTFLKNKIAIYMSGVAAEELVFGEEFKSAGSQMDIIYATDTAASYVRNYGMDSTLSWINKKQTQSTYQANYDVDKTNDVIENLIADEKKRARDFLNKNVKIYKALVQHAVEVGGMSIENFLEICNKNGMNLVQKEINDKLIYSYDDKLNQFLK
jgi:cell division protease FtsH